ncbi:hypothetical protein BIV24_19435 [Streptomyces colonosanans]|uniref:DNA-binding protein n=1 Tax=Streptomyces colonosanans TaxID=1428652 RepID=A0A1S2P822_9ACTN|nr:hypothetical protein BIV24_19435 [Streptomyces colonosanans]
MIRVRTRLTADFTVISNSLAQRRGSAVTVGIAAYILSLPDGFPVSIAALCEHFTEGEILISRALRELEAAGYLERRRERLPTGQIRTRTYFFDVPEDTADPDGPPEPPKPPRPRRQPAPEAATATAVRETVDASAQAEVEPLVPLADADPQAVAVLTALRRVDPRLILSQQEAARLAPAVARWLAAGVEAPQIIELLTTSLPGRLRTRPAGILAFRLRETPLPSHPVEHPTVLPFQACDGCDRAFRSAEPGRCRDCRSGNLRAAG